MWVPIELLSWDVHNGYVEKQKHGLFNIFYYESKYNI